ncbi:MAG: permease-like cell division protein FtsX [Nakamurella sp.]
MFADVMRGLRRNITMTIAMILTTAISLTLLGAGLIVARMTDQMQQTYANKIEVTIYLTKDVSTQDPNCQEKVCQSLGEALSGDTDLVKRATYQSQSQAWEQYQQMFAGQPEMLDIAKPTDLQSSWHVKLIDPQKYKVLAARYGHFAGVDSVVDQSQTLDRLFKVLNGIRNATIIVALVQALAALLLIANTVQVAAYTRRTETSIMRLVGASRWRTQLPFIMEAVVAAVIGALVSIVGLVAMKYLFVDKTLGSIMNAGILPPIDATYLVWVAPWLGGIAVGLAAVASYVTLRLYVRL